MKYLFICLMGGTLFFALAPNHFTPAMIGSHDKLLHFFVFFGLSFGLNLSFPAFSARLLFFLMLIFAASIELFQDFIANRKLSLFDFGAGVLGILGCLIILRLTRVLFYSK